MSPALGDSQRGTRVTRFWCESGADQSHHVRMRPRGERESLGQMRPRCGTEKTGPMMHIGGPESPGAREVPVRTSHLVQVRPRWDHSHQVQVRPRYIREYPGPNDAQVRTRVNSSRRGPNIYQSHCVPGEARWRPQEPGPGEPHMGTRATRSR